MQFYRMKLKSRNDAPDLTEFDNTSNATERVYDEPKLHCPNDFRMGRNQIVPNKPFEHPAYQPCFQTIVKS
jgi:hypothetical protein